MLQVLASIYNVNINIFVPGLQSGEYLQITPYEQKAKKSWNLLWARDHFSSLYRRRKKRVDDESSSHQQKRVRTKK